MYEKTKQTLKETTENRKRVTTTTVKSWAQAGSMWRSPHDTILLTNAKEDRNTGISKERDQIQYYAALARGIMHCRLNFMERECRRSR